MKKRLKIAGLVLGLAMLSIAAILYTPDTSRESMISKYTTNESAFFTSANGQKLHFRDEGNATAPTLVFLHGANSSLHTWTPVINLLKNDFRCISVDLPGHGLTGPALDERYEAPALHKHLLELLDSLAVTESVWIGNSWGGWLTWRAALDHPEHIQAQVLIDASGAVGIEEQKLYLGARLMKSSLGRATMPYFTPRAIIKKSIEHTMFDDALVTETLIDRYWELLRFPGNRHAAATRSISDREPEVFERVSTLTLPTLLLWGESDEVIPVSHARAFNRAIPNSRLIIYPNVAHLPQEELPESVATDIRNFLLALNPASIVSPDQ